ncbi:protein translocase subunit SecD [Rubrimonas cliftonensis]|uniref:Protein translocase subunit SecD n=1 Tax=Rubrimonas cliftonensis TaxID=89524 RepID=A0A1H3VPP7_9RHOB|nr:protein translocase subunit SecD [Rubrimonas cliftonensis]SDZ76088.1 preprotein translocase subunit SecD [Rubrimonas cliftonensis]
MLQYSALKKALVIALCLLGVALTAPNFFYETADEAARARAQVERLEERGAPVPPDLAAQAAAWPSWLPGSVLNLGLDLRGGAHLLVEVRVEDVYAERIASLWPEARSALREAREVVGPFREVDGDRQALEIRLLQPSAAGMDAAVGALEEIAQPVTSGILGGPAGRDIAVERLGDDRLRVTLTEAERAAALERTMAQSLEIVRRRVDEAGTREPTIQRQGERRILIQVPGVGSAEELLALLGETAKLSFHEVVSQTENAQASAAPGEMIVPDADQVGLSYVLQSAPTVAGENLVDASTGFDQDGRPAVNFRFDTAGARAFGDYTRANVGKVFAIVLDGQVISAPRIISAITGGSGQITGSFDVAEANRLAILLRAGALPAEIEVLEQRTVGPELGADSVAAGKIATVVALIAVMVFMGLSYGLFGLFANVALIVNIALIIGVLSALGATLTLPGIAGIVLTIGMAVDANVLVFERIREELKRSKGPARAIEAGYERALSAIVDANITTLIAAVILFAMGSGPVKGFAVTLSVGVVTSVFTAIMVTRLMVATWFEARRPKALAL